MFCSLATTLPPSVRRLAALAMVAGCFVVQGCGDRCEQLCVQAGAELQRCKPDGLDWRDLGARSRTDFTNGCREDWDRTASDLTATEVREALDVCADTSQALDRMTCAEIAALYAPLD